MEKLRRIILTPSIAAVWLLGLALATGLDAWNQGWLHAKLALVLVVIGYHHVCARLLRRFEADTNRLSHRWFRWFNELPVLLLVAIVVLAVVKPF